VAFKPTALRSFVHRYAEGIGLAVRGLVGMVPSHHIRLFFYRRLFGMTIGSGATIYRNPEIRRPAAVTIGEHTIIGRNAILDGRCGLTIGNNVNFSTGVWVWSLEHDKDSPDFGPKGAPVVINDRAWLSSRSTILPGVTIGEGAVVCAGAVVTSDVAPYEVVAGVPARKIADRNRDLRYTFKHRLPFA
jgi:acetyltransferase-like isoleucine patch superfamily enzyme